RRRHGRRMRPPHPAEDRGRGDSPGLPRLAIRAAAPRLWRDRAVDPERRSRNAAGGQPGRVQAAQPAGTHCLPRQRGVARQGRRLCDPGPRRRADRVDRRLLFECGRAAVVRDGAVARRPRIPPSLPGDLLIGAGPGEWRAAWVEAGATVELYVERGDTAPAGSIHLGRVVRRTPGLDAVLVDIGSKRPGFLALGDAAADQRLDEGARVIVQVRREAQQDKGARLSVRIAPRQGLEPAELAARAVRLEPPAQLDPPPGFAGALALRLPARPEQIFTDEAAI